MHAFTGWDGPILTDSGGFQVFSLRDTLARVDDEGVTFRSVYDGAPGAPDTRGRGRDPGAPRLRHRDVPRHLPAGDASRREHEEAVRRTQLWAERQVDAPRADGQLRFGIAQGGTDRDCADDRSKGSSVFRSTASRSAGSRWARAAPEMLDAVAWAAPELPSERPRYFMGLGDAEGILEVIARGIDMFDCVLPTRTARTGSALTARGPAQPAQRALRPRPAAARGRLRLPRVRRVLARVRPASREPAGAPRPAAPHAA